MEYLQKLAVSVNMPFVNITLDVGAAMNAHKMIWNNEIKFSNIVIHLVISILSKEIFRLLVISCPVQVSKTWLFKQISVLRAAVVVSCLDLIIAELGLSTQVN